MNVEQLRQSIKAQWLSYYRDNRAWITRVGVWVSCEGQRRPSSSFILATLAVLEPKLTQLLPLIVELSSNPDRIVIALGLNVNPDDELENLKELDEASEYVRMLPSGSAAIAMPIDPVLADPMPMEPMPVDSVPSEPVLATPRVNHSAPPAAQAVEPKPVEPKPVEFRTSEPRVAEPRTFESRAAEPRVDESKPIDRDRNHYANHSEPRAASPSPAPSPAPSPMPNPTAPSPAPTAPPPSTRGVGFKPSAKPAIRPASQPAETKPVQRTPMDTVELGLDELPNRDPVDEPPA